ncbi:MAG: type II secretion system protein [Candidatus Sumerlaeia bacterium]|nr:type II secretion system protein [Candidatus Sumerlaeia bacterium]
MSEVYTSSVSSITQNSTKLPMKYVNRNSFSRLTKRSSFSLVEVLVATAISAIVTISSIGTIIYHQRVAAMNQRLAALTNLMESQLETIRNQTWFTLVNDTNGWFNPDPNGTRSGAWPEPDDLTSDEDSEDRTLYSSVDVISDGTTTTPDYTGIVGNVEIWYTPLVLRHMATTDSGQQVAYNVRYWKVEVIVSLTGSNRIRLQNDPDVWTAITYISELMGRGDAEFSSRTLGRLRARQQVISGGGS